MHQPIEDYDIFHFYDPGYGVGYCAGDQLIWCMVVKCETGCVVSKLGLNTAAGASSTTF